MLIFSFRRSTEDSLEFGKKNKIDSLQDTTHNLTLK